MPGAPRRAAGSAEPRGGRSRHAAEGLNWGLVHPRVSRHVRSSRPIRAGQCPPDLRGAPQRAAAELPAAVDGGVELASARLPADRGRRRRDRLPLLQRALRPGGLKPRRAEGSAMPGRKGLTVVQLLPALESGGVERSTIEISQALAAAGHRAIVVSAGGRLVPELQGTGAEHIALDIGRKSPLTFRHVPALRRLVVGLQADIVHARSRLPAWIGWRALQRMSATQRPHFVTTVHGLNSPSRYSAIMARGERVVCVSETVRAHVMTHYPATDGGLLRVIPRGIEPSAFPRRPLPDRDARAAVAAQFPVLGGDGPLLLLPGRGTRLKGHADALALLAAIRAGGADARLWMPGA